MNTLRETKMTQTLTREGLRDPISLGGGIRLDHALRDELRQKFYNSPKGTYEALGMDHMAFNNIISSKRLNIPLALRFQKVLDVDLISEEQLRISFESFVDYLKDEYSL